MTRSAESFSGTWQLLRPDERCAVCSGPLPENVYSVSGIAGVFCSDACLSKAVTCGD